MKDIGVVILSTYEKNILNKKKNSKADLIIRDEKTLTVLQNMLDQKVTQKLEDGTSVNATAKELIIASAIRDAINKGSFDKLKVLLEITGEFKKEETHNLNISLVDQSLRERALD